MDAGPHGQHPLVQTHQTQWSWMTSHMGDIGYMHDHWGQWNGWRSGGLSGSSGGTPVPTAAGADQGRGWALAWVGKPTWRSYGR
jgi:hypothetical protein